MPTDVAMLLGLIAALVCTVLVLIFITPEKKKPTLNKFFAFLHNLFNFKFLMIETILKVLYIFSTLFMVGAGFFLLFAGNETYFGGFQSTALSGLLMMILGPIIIRIVYECMMLVILIAKNVIQINGKMAPAQNAEQAPEQGPQFGMPEVPVAPPAPQPVPQPVPQPAPQPAAPAEIFCPQCGYRCNADQDFCPQCGNKLK